MRILEIGCAEGGLGRLIKSKFNVYYAATELSVDAIEAEKHLDLVIRATSSSVANGPYDLIISFHVLEHVPDVGEEISRWAALLSESGGVVAEVPEESGHRLVQHDRNPEHLHFFTASSLTALFQHEGFTLSSLSAGHFESPLYSNSLRLIGQLRPSDDTRRKTLLDRFSRRFDAPFAIFGTGGDFESYVLPVLERLPVVAIFDSNERQWGKRVKSYTIEKFEANKYPQVPILIASLRFNAEISAQLRSEGVPSTLISGIDEIYGGQVN